MRSSRPPHRPTGRHAYARRRATHATPRRGRRRRASARTRPERLARRSAGALGRRSGRGRLPGPGMELHELTRPTHRPRGSVLRPDHGPRSVPTAEATVLRVRLHSALSSSSPPPRSGARPPRDHRAERPDSSSALVYAAGQQGVPALTAATSVRNVYAAAGIASPIVLVAGILGMTTEYRYQTITPDVPVTPCRAGSSPPAADARSLSVWLDRGRSPLIAQLVAALLALRPRHHAPIAASTVLQISGGALLGYALYAVVGVSVGALVRSQVAAILGALLWSLVIENVCWPSWFAPGHRPFTAERRRPGRSCTRRQQRGRRQRAPLARGGGDRRAATLGR